MFRKILSAVFALFMFVPFAHSAEMVNVEYVHKVLLNRWGIDLPYNPALKNPQVAANMKYLLTVVDIANAYLNGKKTTDYGNGEYATLAAADTIATNTAMDTLVNMPTFTITTTPDTTSFMLVIGASGNFVIDWGDGNTEKILNKTIGMGVYEHTYATAGTYEIKLSGRATGYPTLNMETGDGIVFSVMNSGPNVAKISGKLGQIFSTLPDGTNPNFAAAFGGATNLTEIPADLFDGVSGAPVLGMFVSTFNSTPIASIPDGLFDGIVGAPAASMFASTFEDTPITSIPDGLFAGISGAPAENMFDRTFANTRITSIPDGLFAGISGAPAEYMFNSTFYNTQITSVPTNVFGNLTGDGAPNMFADAFRDCSDLTSIEGPLFAGTLTPAESMFYGTFRNTGITNVPTNVFGNLTGDGAPNMFANAFVGCSDLTSIEGPLFAGTLTPAESMFQGTFYNANITSIPDGLFDGIVGAPAKRMFSATFSDTQITSIPDGLFAGISGAPAEYMFESTFSDTPITSIPDGLFAGISGAPAEYMFAGTFSHTPITSIPENLFGDISGAAAQSMFQATFSNCTSLTGPSARIGGKYLYEIWPNYIGGTYQNATGLSDYDQIPSRWK